jgi:hypothetical protein
MTRRLAHPVWQPLAAATLATVVVAGSLFLWIGIPVLGLRVLGQITAQAQHFVILAICGIPLAMVGFGWLLYRINGVYEDVRGAHGVAVPEHAGWLRSVSDERVGSGAMRGPRRLIDLAMTVSAWTAIVLMLVWFFLFAEMRLITG